jgi:hypothetical protein
MTTFSALPFKKTALVDWRVTLLLTAGQGELNNRLIKNETIKTQITSPFLRNLSLMATPQIEIKIQ